MTHPAIPIVRRLAAENPDRHAICVYATEDATEPVCIIGHAAHELGAPLDILARDPHLTTCDALALAPIPPPGPLSPEGFWLSTVQFEQDEGASWSQAVQTADNFYPL